MCIQTVGLIQAAIERVGIPTVSISLLKEVTEAIKPPRAFFVPFKMGFPLAAPNNPGRQMAVIKQALALLERADTPILQEFRP